MKLSHPATILSTWFYSGLLKPAPGTWGTLAALPFGYGLLMLDNIYIMLAAIALVTLLGLWSAHIMEQHTGIHDDKRIVIDEVTGMWIALLPASLNPLSILLAFALFRLFDILKPWPISIADKRINGSLGVMLDDILAGAIAGFCLLGISYAVKFI
jgi:phosphatidylglycerophosphatase A